MVGAKRRSGTHIKRLNLYLDQATFDQIESVAKMRGIENGAAARQLIEERIKEILGVRGKLGAA